MIDPSEVHAASEKFIDENNAFREFLREHANPKELDNQFYILHNELFSGYNCSACGNCCRIYYIVLRKGEVGSIASYLGISNREFIATYLTLIGEEHGIKPPCAFLSPDGLCLIQECKPEVCRDYPYTDKKERLSAMWSIISAAEHCPVVFEILERLKMIYQFK